MEKNTEPGKNKKYSFICPQNHRLNSENFGDGERTCKICGRMMKLEKVWFFKVNELKGEESD